MIREWLANATGVLMGGALLALVLALVGCVPWVSLQALKVLVHREWIPPVYALRSIGKRRVMALGTLGGLAMVIFVLATILMLADGIRQTLVTTGEARNVKIMLKGVAAEGHSFLTRGQLNLLTVVPQAARNAEGKPLVAPEAIVLAWATAVGSDPEAGANLSVRGVSPISFQLNPLKHLKGRLFNPGAFEVVIGKALEGKYEGATLGGRLSLAGHDWQVVGVAEHTGSAYDSEAWTDVDQLRSTFKREASVVTLALRDDRDFASLQAMLASSPLLTNLQVRREAEYWESIGQRYVDFVRLMGGLVGAIFGFAAVLGAMNTMNAQVSARTRELGALRAIGFRPRAILTSLVLESIMLGVLGGAIGIVAAALLHGVELKLTPEKTMTEMSYAFHFSLPTALFCTLVAAFIGFAGGLLPALKASRMRIVDAVRAE